MTWSVPGQLSLLGCCLSERDAAVLAFAAAHHLQGRVGKLVGTELGCSEVRYYQLLSRLLDRPEALEAQPELIGRLRELRDRRARLRRAAAGPAR